jgi:hypothetical protein
MQLPVGPPLDEPDDEPPEEPDDEPPVLELPQATPSTAIPTMTQIFAISIQCNLGLPITSSIVINAVLHDLERTGGAKSVARVTELRVAEGT